MKGKIFNAQEVQAIIAGNKTQFREVIKFSNSKTTRDFQEIALKKILEGFSEYNICLSSFFKVPYQVGQEIFCKESWAVNKQYNNFDPRTCFAAMGGDVKYCVAYDSNNEFKVDDWAGKKRSAKSMPQWASRLTLQITGIRVERLQSIGCADFFADTGRRPISHMDLDCDTPDPRNDFKVYWNATHKKPEEKFEASPWVWCVTFNQN
jgi:hypothetical protein